MRAAMAKASSIVLAGFELRTDVMCAPPRPLRDGRGAAMWDRVMKLIVKRQNMPASATTKAA